MDNLNQKITEILQDPSRMQQIMEMASAMGFQPPEENTTVEMPSVQEAFQQVSQVLQKTEVQENRQQTLIRALLPYLSPRRQAKLERAMQLSRISLLAGAALQNQVGTMNGEEENHV